MMVVAKRQIHEIRKEELIIATLRSIRKYGYVNSTINTIAEESGLSRGLINHYFESKDDLLILATRYYWRNVDEFFRHVVSSTRGGHFEKLLHAVYVTFLRDTGYDRMMVHYYSAAYLMPAVLEMHRDMWGRYRTSIERRISAVAREKNIVLNTRLAAITLTQLVDGLWLGVVMEESYSREDCRRILRQWLCEQFGEDPENYPLDPDFDLNNYETSAPLPAPE
jgi:TetR/AcrR family transcriptional repressor of bet genes